MSAGATEPHVDGAGADAVEQLPCAVISFGLDLRVVAVNERLCRLVGRDRRTVVGAPLDALLSGAGRLLFHNRVFPQLRLSGSVHEVLLSLVDATGETVPVLVEAARRPSSGGAVDGGRVDGDVVYDCVLVGVSQRDRWEREAIQARRAAEHERDEQGRMAAVLADVVAQLERSTAELKETHWLLARVADVLAICMGCAKVRSGEGDWEMLAEFFVTNSNFLSHGYCPECAVQTAAEWGFVD